MLNILAEIHGYLFSAVCQRGACHIDSVKIEGLQFIHIPTALTDKADHACERKSQMPSSKSDSVRETVGCTLPSSQ